jgi:hypothetical protein
LSATRGELSTFLRHVGVAPNAAVIAVMSVEQAMYRFAFCAGLTPAQCAPNWTVGGRGEIDRTSFVATSRILTKPVDPQALVDAIAGSGVSVLIDPISGVAGRVDATAAAFPHRDALATVQLYSEGSNRAVIDTLRTRLGELMGPHGYVNYIDPSMPNWADAYYGANLARLRTIASTYDPDQIFRFPQGVNG